MTAIPAAPCGQLAWTLAPDGRLASTSQAWLTYTGLTWEQIQGWSFQQAFHPADLDRWLERWSSPSGQAPWQAAVRLRGANGQFQEFLLRIEPLLDARPEGAGWLVTAQPAAWESAPAEPDSLPATGLPAWSASDSLEDLWLTIESLMGVCPSFFRLAQVEPPIARALFSLACFAYLENPLPALFKEAVFVQLSRFCRVRYCLARHCGFLLGRGYVAGAAECPPISVEEVHGLLAEPVPSPEELPVILAELNLLLPLDNDWPPLHSPLGRGLRMAAMVIFLRPSDSAPWIAALDRLLGPRRREQLVLLTAFVQLAHYWTEAHAELGLAFETDLQELLAEHELLAKPILQSTEPGLDFEVGGRLHAELRELRAASESARRLREITDALPALIAHIDASQRYTYVNEGYAEFFQRPASEITGLEVAELLGSEHYGHIRPRLEQALRGELTRYDYTLRDPRTGALRHKQVTYVPDRRSEGSIAGCFVLLVDITDQKEAEQALQASEERFRRLADAMPQLVWTASPDGVVDYYNARVAEYGQISRGPDGDWQWKPVVHDDDLPRTMAAWQAAVQQGKQYQCEHRIRKAAGDFRWHLSRAVPMLDEESAVIRWFGTATDIHDQKMAEEKLAQADRRKDEFLAMLAHELRNPMAPIRNAAAILRQLRIESPELEWCGSVIERQVGQLTRLMDDLVDVSRVSRGKIVLQRAAIDLRAVVDHALEMSRPLITARRHVLEVSVPEQPLVLDGDFARLTQVVSNLLNNAAKYTDEGGRIELSVDPVHSTVVLRVRDNGRGVDPAHLPQLFDLFYQTDRNLDRSEGGLGIGLSLVKSLVEMHGGAVAAHSDGPGRGSEFVVRLPLLATPAPAPPAADSASVDGARLKLLVVDDNRDSAESLATLLRLLGHDVATAFDGPSGVELALARQPDMVLLDIGLPGLDGFQACRQLRSAGLTRARIVALTGYGQEDDQRRSQAAGFDAHHVKPLDLETLRRLLAEAGKNGA